MLSSSLRRRTAAVLLWFVMLISSPAVVQAQNSGLKWLTWSALQVVPSPVFMDDRGPCGGRLIPALQWHLTPLNYSFAANRLVSPLSVLIVNPVRRYGGSVELFFQPEWTLSGFEHAGLQRFMLVLGTRGYIPVDEFGEYLSVSVGGAVLLRRSAGGAAHNAGAIEAGVHTLFGILGLQVRYQFVSDSRYTIGLILRYY